MSSHLALNSSCTLTPSNDERMSSVYVDSGDQYLSLDESSTPLADKSKKPKSAADLMTVAGTLSLKVVDTINIFWSATSYDGPRLQLLDVHFSVNGQKLAAKARCLVCDEYVTLSVVQDRAVSIYNYKSHVSRKHISREENGKQFLKGGKSQAKISNFFTKVPVNSTVSANAPEENRDARQKVTIIEDVQLNVMALEKGVSNEFGQVNDVYEEVIVDDSFYEVDVEGFTAFDDTIEKVQAIAEESFVPSYKKVIYTTKKTDYTALSSSSLSPLRERQDIIVAGNSNSEECGATLDTNKSTFEVSTYNRII